MVNLEIEEIKNGINKCFNNSKSLLGDADYLYEGKRVARSFAIYVLCMEEIQKTYLLFRILIEKETNKVFTKEEKDYYSKFFSRHTLKIKAAGIQSSSYNDFAERHSLIKIKKSNEINNEISNSKQKDILKQQGFYTDLVHNKFKEPSEMIKIEKCNSIQAEAKLSLFQLTGFKVSYFNCPAVYIDKFKKDNF